MKQNTPDLTQTLFREGENQKLGLKQNQDESTYDAITNMDKLKTDRGNVSGKRSNCST